MKKVKRALLGTALAGAVIVGASVGTYSWFNAQVESSAVIQNYTLKLNKTEIFPLNTNGEKLAPGRFFNEKFNIENKGELEQIVKASLNFKLYKDDTLSQIDIGKYDITVKVTWTDKNKNEIGSIVNTKTAAEANEFDGWLPTVTPNRNFNPGDNMLVEITYGLNSSADNNYQGLTLKGDFKFDGKQTDEGSKFMGEQ